MLSVRSLWVGLYPQGDDPIKDLYGVELKVYINGNIGDTGKLYVNWGNYQYESFDIANWGLGLGANNLGNSLPVGTHNICVDVATHN